MPKERPIVIRRGTFVCTLYDIGNLMKLPLATIRKLWKIMFDTAYQNEDTIAAICNWLPLIKEQTAEHLAAQKVWCDEESAAERIAQSNLACFGTVATKEHKQAVKDARRRVKSAEGAVKAATAAQTRAHKLQNIFNDMAAKAKL